MAGKHEIDMTVHDLEDCTMNTTLKRSEPDGAITNINAHSYFYTKTGKHFLTMGGESQVAGNYFYHFAVDTGYLKSDYLIMHTYQ